MTIINRILGFEFIGNRLHYFAIILLVFSLPISSFLVSFAQFVLFGNWVLQGQFKLKWERYLSNKAYLFLILPLVHIIYLFNTGNFDYALHDLKIKIPLLILPILIGSSEYLNNTKVRTIGYFFVLGVFISTLVSTWYYLGYGNILINSYRDLSPFISHIRLGLMVVFSIFILLYYLRQHSKKSAANIVSIIGIVWFLIFIVFILPTLSAWAVLYFTVVILFFFYHQDISNKVWRFSYALAIILVPLFVLLITFQVISNRGNQALSEVNDFPAYTALGNAYEKPVDNYQKENGYFVYARICREEVEQNWTKMSAYDLYGKDRKGHNLYSTLFRYLSSANYSKDSLGLSKLSQEDISLIEQGITSYIYKTKSVPYQKTYELVEELHSYFDTGDSNGKSVAMRMEFWKTAVYIIKKNFWFGTGTGDIGDAFNEAYDETNSTLNNSSRLRAHNQYLTFFIAFGLFGFILSVYGMFIPAFRRNAHPRFLFIAFLSIVFLSMFSEDTLETQVGVTFYISFYTVLLAGKSEKND